MGEGWGWGWGNWTRDGDVGMGNWEKRGGKKKRGDMEVVVGKEKGKKGGRRREEGQTGQGGKKRKLE